MLFVSLVVFDKSDRDRDFTVTGIDMTLKIVYNTSGKCIGRFCITKQTR